MSETFKGLSQVKAENENPKTGSEVFKSSHDTSREHRIKMLEEIVVPLHGVENIPSGGELPLSEGESDAQASPVE